MLATIPALVAAQIRVTRPHLETKPLPFPINIEGSHLELLWPHATNDDEPGQFIRAQIRGIAKTLSQ